MSDVVKFYPADAAKEPDNVLEQAMGRYSEVLIIGWDKDGDFDARASMGLAKGSEVLWLVETFKAKLMNGGFITESEETT